MLGREFLQNLNEKQRNISNISNIKTELNVPKSGHSLQAVEYKQTDLPHVRRTHKDSTVRCQTKIHLLLHLLSQLWRNIGFIVDKVTYHLLQRC